MAGGARRVYLSTSGELDQFPQPKSFMDAATNAVMRAGDVPREMSDLPASSAAPAELVRRQVLDSDVYIGVLGFRYGALVPDLAISYAEFEYQTATSAGIPTIMFLLDENALIPASLVADDAQSVQRQGEFRERLMQDLPVRRFDSRESLELGILNALVTTQAQPLTRDHGVLRSVLILYASQARDLAMMLARELAPEAGAVVWPLESRPRMEQAHAERLQERLNNADLALIILDGKRQRDESVSVREWFEIGEVVGALGRARVFLVTPSAVPNFARELGLTTLTISKEHFDPSIVRTVAAKIRSHLLVTERRSRSQPNSYSCFLSYASADSDFVERIYPDLQDAGISCWLDRADLPTGVRWDQELFRGLAGQDKVLVVLSHHSVRSRWVRTEVRRAVELERERQRPVLFPIRVDDAVFDTDRTWARELTSRQIGDFTNWLDHDSYRRSLRACIKVGHGV